MSNLTWWDKHEAIARLQGCQFTEFKWYLDFKPEGYYIDSDWDMNTTCWYVHVEAVGYVRNYCAKDSEEAVNTAIAKTIAEIEEGLSLYNGSYKQKEWQELLEKIKNIVETEQ